MRIYQIFAAFRAPSLRVNWVPLYALVLVSFFSQGLLANEPDCTGPEVAFSSVKEDQPIICNQTYYYRGEMTGIFFRKIWDVMANDILMSGIVRNIKDAYTSLILKVFAMDYQVKDAEIISQVSTRTFPWRRFVVSSTGGYFRPAIWLGAHLKKFRVKFEVPDSGECSSACTYLFFSSVERKMGKGSQLLIHRPRMGKIDCKQSATACENEATSWELTASHSKYARNLLAKFLTTEELGRYDSYQDLIFSDQDAAKRGWLSTTDQSSN